MKSEVEVTPDYEHAVISYVAAIGVVFGEGNVGRAQSTCLIWQGNTMFIDSNKTKLRLTFCVSLLKFHFLCNLFLLYFLKTLVHDRLET